MILPQLRRGAGIITMAFGPEKYIDFAVGLAHSIRSFDRWHGQLAIVTDRPADRFGPLFDQVIPIEEGFGGGVEQKLSLDRYTPFEESMFVDCDSLVFRSLEPTADVFRDVGSFGALAGHYVLAGESHYGLSDVDAYLRHTGIDRLPAFNSGVLWWTPDGDDVFENARAIASGLPAGLVRGFKMSRLPDEPLLGAAMELLEVDYAASRATHMLPTVAAESLKGIDVVSGHSAIATSDGVVEPAVVHFNFAGQDSVVYARERYRAAHPLADPRLATIACMPRWAKRHGISLMKDSIKRRRSR